MKHVNLRISGKVQGVFFRASTRDKARELNINGFVRNETDGSVYVEAEADEEAIDRFVGWCTMGPVRARVEKIEVSPGAVRGFNGFDVVR